MLRIVAVRGPSAPQPRRECICWNGLLIRKRPVGADAHIGPHAAPSNVRTAPYGQNRLVPHRRAGACPRRRCGFAGIRRLSSLHTARRHTQVPPYIPGWTVDVVRRAGPVCPAAGMHRPIWIKPIGSDRVGRGLAPAAGAGSPEYAGYRHSTPHGGTHRCRPTFPDGLSTWFVGRDLCVPPLECTAPYG